MKKFQDVVHSSLTVLLNRTIRKLKRASYKDLADLYVEARAFINENFGKDQVSIPILEKLVTMSAVLSALDRRMPAGWISQFSNADELVKWLYKQER